MRRLNPLRQLKERWPEVRAALGWMLHSWLRPAGHEGEWEQKRETDESRHVPFG